ncbi:hypothetical protein SDC9_127934 [bioreactor metagenome]|uniref:ThuA-like domain-containing protein n=1 Tax=bioreactor metagenome TaxID=1076179 RepID=A0A645CVG3_9ZZZZ
MIYFFADDHYETHAGRTIFEDGDQAWTGQTIFRENDWSLLESGDWTADCGLLILHLIGGSSGQIHPGPGAEARVRHYLDAGGNILLLHGASAAFWQWPWWRKIVGLRWVRPDDPDGMAASVHPHVSCALRIAKVRHPLAAQLCEGELPEDELYTELEQTAPLTILIHAVTATGIFPQMAETVTPAGGRILSFLPGHARECATHPVIRRNVAAAIADLRQAQSSIRPPRR